MGFMLAENELKTKNKSAELYSQGIGISRIETNRGDNEIHWDFYVALLTVSSLAKFAINLL